MARLSERLWSPLKSENPMPLPSVAGLWKLTGPGGDMDRWETVSKDQPRALVSTWRFADGLSRNQRCLPREQRLQIVYRPCRRVRWTAHLFVTCVPVSGIGYPHPKRGGSVSFMAGTYLTVTDTFQ